MIMNYHYTQLMKDHDTYMNSKYHFKELMNERHSVRKFSTKEVPENVLK